MSDSVTELVKEVFAGAVKLPWHEREAHVSESTSGLESVEKNASALLRKYQRRPRVIVERSASRISTLTLEWRHESTPDPRGADYLDFIVDGRSLEDMLETDRHPWLGRASRKVLEDLWGAALLLAEPAFAFGRVPLYLCKICGDLGCGADTVRIERTQDSFFWSAFADETPWEAPWYHHDLGPFRFHRRQYVDCLQRGLAQATARAPA